MAATQWPQQYQQYQQPQYAQSQQYQQPQQHQQNQNYQPQQYQQPQQHQPTQQYQIPPNSQPTQPFQQQAQGYTVQQYQQNQQYQAPHYLQPQQDQPRQQYHQNQQGPTAQQYQQIQRSQPAQQYPQQQAHQLQQGQPPQQYPQQQSHQPQHGQPPQQYPQQQSHQPPQGQNGYQHQHGPQKYQSQQHAPRQQGFPSQHCSPPTHNLPQQPVVPQQYGTSQTGAYQQTHQPQRSTTNGQNSTWSGPQPCFNCGNSGHFAMDCPEPIREVPAGKINPQAFQNPLRRPKAGGTVATQHQHRPNPGHAQASPIGHPPSPHGQTGYPQHSQYQQASSPATPLSAHSPAQAQYYQQWQEYYQSQQAYQQGSPYNQQPYTKPHGQTTAYSNGSQTPRQTSVQALPHTGGPQIYQSQFVPTSATPAQFNQQSFNDKATAHPDQRAQSSASVKSHPTPPNPDQIQVLDYNFEEDDLDSLDIPDLPKNTSGFTNASQEPINLIGQPLPGNFVVADALAPFLQPAPQDQGCCKSKYHHDASLDVCLETFKNSKYWDKEHADDVAFSDLPADGKIIPVDEILWMIRQRRAHPELSDNTNRDSRSQSRTVSMNQDSLEVKNTLDQIERELAETKAKLQTKLDKGRVTNPVHASPLRSVKAEQPPFRDHDIKEEYQTPPQSATLEKPIKFEQDAEDVLAALGVTGAPKPVTTTTWPDQYTGIDSPHDMQMSRSSRSSSRADNLIADQNRVQSKSGEHQTNGLSSYNQNYAPPPPPQTFSRRQSHPDGTHGSPYSAGLVSVDPFGYNTNGVNHSNGDGNVNGTFSPPTDGQSSSPIELRSENSLSRKRHRYSSSDEEDTPKRRQQDDYMPKFKKRQPKVDDAYSRRW